MERRTFLQQGTLAGISALTLGAGAAAHAAASTQGHAANTGTAGAKTFNMNYAPHDGMFKNSAGDNFLDQIRFMHDQGFRGIEDNGMLKREPAEQEKIGNLLAKLDMQMGVFVIEGGDNWKVSLATGKQEFKDTFVKTCKAAVETAKRCNAKWATVVPGFF